MHLALRLSYRWLLFLVLCCAAPAAAQPAATAEMAAPLADPLAALLEQARALMTRGEPAAALQVLEQAPPDPRVVFARTHALSTLGRHTEAAQSLEGYLRAPPQVVGTARLTLREPTSGRVWLLLNRNLDVRRASDEQRSAVRNKVRAVFGALARDPNPAARGQPRD